MKIGQRNRLERATFIAYGGWLVLALAIVGAALASLHQVRQSETTAVLARSERGAAALEETMRRVFEGTHTLGDLAQTRHRLTVIGNNSGRLVVEQQMAEWAQTHRFGIDEVLIVRRGGVLDWSSADPVRPRVVTHRTRGARPPVTVVPAPRIVALDSVDGGALAISQPMRAPAGRWITRVTLPLDGGDATLVVSIDAVALSGMIATEGQEGPGEVGLVQRRADGAILARTSAPASAFSERPSDGDPVLQAATSAPVGRWHQTHDGVDRMVAFRAPTDLPVIVSQVADTRVALGDFFRLQRSAALIAGVLLVASFAATQLVLSNFLLRRRLAQQMLHDPLTGLPNRRYYTDVMPARLASANHAGSTAAVLLIDLDGFKYINDSRGHAIGDGMLQEVARRLRACAGEHDQLMRLGGDEFVLVRLDRQQRRDATSLARFIISELGRTYDIDGYQLRVNASVGVAFPPEGGDNLNDLLRRADIALYTAKGDGGGGHRLFDPTMEETVRSRRALEMDLREALLRQELEVYYQPLVQLDPRRVSGFEALVRWHHPVHGMVMPGSFIPMAEETGLISGIGQWVLRQACMEATRWPANTRIAVNISPVQFDRSDIVDVVAAALRESRLDPSRLELEITEGVVLLDTGEALATMRRLQALGVRLALDDFGTGYSSLSYLRSFPFDKVKIDGSFLSDLRGDGGAIIRAVLSLCAHLELDTLVEGVETEEQLRWLRTEGCTEVQGHLFSEPQPAQALPGVMEDVVASAVPRARVVNFVRKG